MKVKSLSFRAIIIIIIIFFYPFSPPTWLVIIILKFKSLYSIMTITDILSCSLSMFKCICWLQLL